MKKLFFAIVLGCCYFSGIAQEKITPAYARAVCVNTLANFTESASFAYTRGITYDAFKKKLCGITTPVDAGEGMLKAAYTYLSQGATKDQIIKQNDGKAVASAFQFLLGQHNKGINSDGTELFGSKEILEKASVGREAGCRWYQFWCLVSAFANWVVANWATIAQIIGVLNNL